MRDRANGARIRIGLLWHSDRSRNLGVGALTIGNIALTRQVAAELGVTPQFTLFMPAAGGAPYVCEPDVSVVQFNTLALIDPTNYWRRLGQLDLMLDIGAGDSFADIYPLSRFRNIMLTKMLTVARRVPLILSPQTIGPFDKPGYTQAAAWVLRNARAVVVRDDQSAAAVRKLAPHIAPVNAVDVAFALPWTKAVLPPTDKIRVGVNVSGLLYGGGYTGKGEFQLGLDYRAFTDRLLAALDQRGDVQVHLVPHVVETLGTDGDCQIADELAEKYPRFVRAPNFASPSDAKGYIAALDLLIGARMHATIAAFSSGVPVVPVSYSRKFEGLFGTLGYRWLVPHRGVSTDEALAFTLAAVDRRADISADLATGMLKIAGRLEAYRAVLRDAMGDILRARPSERSGMQTS